MKTLIRTEGIGIRTAVSVLGMACLFAGPARVEAGAFVFADALFPDTVIHPSNYAGTGGEVTVTVCIDPADPNAADLETPVKNIVSAINAFAPVQPNLILGASNDILPGEIDFESLTFHEFGHCLGLAHPNLATESGLSDPERNGTKALVGTNTIFDVAAGVDLAFGSSDDVRGDDINLHWAETGVNNPFLLPSLVDSSTYVRPGTTDATGHLFTANAGRDVAPLLGFGDTEAVMQQGQFFDEDQRAPANDDIATLMFAMTGVDETAGTADDYTIKMEYAGLTTVCDILVAPVSAGFASCSFGGSFPYVDDNHGNITTGTFTYNSTEAFWYFNQTLACLDISLDWPHNQLLKHSVCGNITLESGFLVGAMGTVTLEANTVTFEPGTSVVGNLTIWTQ